MATLHEAQTWRGQDVLDRGGDKVGKLEHVFLDRRTGEPTFAAVTTGLLGTRPRLVPIAGFSRTAEGLTVAYDEATIKDAPDVDAGESLSPEAERRLLRHYGASGD